MDCTRLTARRCAPGRREIGERSEAALESEAVERSGAALLAGAVAGAVAGTHRAALRELRRRIMAGEPPA
ncbi:MULTISPECIES: hypothetical protein [unclassified Kitasatospora]|uniref:hypothetical protein n=1 Tax=unclassified Kitasatospora TaxID=2633591 RepID=UPI003401B42D